MWLATSGLQDASRRIDEHDALVDARWWSGAVPRVTWIAPVRRRGFHLHRSSADSSDLRPAQLRLGGREPSPFDQQRSHREPPGDRSSASSLLIFDRSARASRPLQDSIPPTRRQQPAQARAAPCPGKGSIAAVHDHIVEERGLRVHGDRPRAATRWPLITPDGSRPDPPVLVIDPVITTDRSRDASIAS